LKQFGEFIINNTRLVFFGLIVIVLLAIYPAGSIKTDFNLEGFYQQGDQVIENYQLLEDEFGRDDNIILIGFKTDSLFTKSVLKDLYNLIEELKHIEFLEDVLSLWSAREIRSMNDQLSFENYLDEEKFDQLDFQQLKREITSDPFLRGFLVNEHGNATSIALVINEELNNYSNRNIIIHSLEEILSGYSPKYDFHISGIPYFRNQYVNMLNRETISYIAISSIFIFILLWYLYRTIWGILFPMMIVWSTLLFTIALIYLTGSHLEIMSSTIPPILLCVGVADAVHMISKYDDSRESGMNKKSSIIEMLKTLGNATFLTSVTTAIGFASLISSTVVPMKKFGLYTAMGVLIAYLVTIVFLPAALSISRKKRVVDEKSGVFYPFIHQLLIKLSAFNRLYYGKILIGGMFITAFFGIGLKTVNVDGRVFDDVSKDSRLMIDSRFFSENLAPQFPMEFMIDTGLPDEAITADFLERVYLFEQKLLNYPEIHRVTGLHTLISHVHEVMSDHGSDKESGLPDSDQAIAQYILLLEINETDELYRLVDFDYRKLRIAAFVEDAGSKRINEIRDDLQNNLQSLFPDEEIIVTGTTILSADLTEKIVYSLVWSILLALTAITLIMVLLFKNIRMIIISLVPNILPLIVVGGIMGFTNVDIKPSTAVIFTIALGIAVDDSIHYLARFRIEYLKSKAMLPALSATTIRTGRAIIITSLILIAGFGSLITSAFTSTAMLGLLVCATIFTALIADLLILPSLFYWLRPKLGIVKNPR
jgi:uncharacterized protein